MSPEGGVPVPVPVLAPALPAPAPPDQMPDLPTKRGKGGMRTREGDCGSGSEVHLAVSKQSRDQ